MKILKEHFYDIVRLYINQVGVTIFSMFLYLAIGEIDDESLFMTLRIAVSVLSILFYIVLIYNVVWELGAKDKIRIDSRRYDPKPYKGIVIALFANLPNLLLGTLSAVFCSVFLASGAEWAKTAFGIVFLITKFHAPMFMGIIQGVTPANPSLGSDPAIFTDALFESIWFIVLPLVIVLITEGAYLLGSHEKRIFGFLGKKDNQGKK